MWKLIGWIDSFAFSQCFRLLGICPPGRQVRQAWGLVRSALSRELGMYHVPTVLSRLVDFRSNWSNSIAESLTVPTLVSKWKLDAYSMSYVCMGITLRV